MESQPCGSLDRGQSRPRAGAEERRSKRTYDDQHDLCGERRKGTSRWSHNRVGLSDSLPRTGRFPNRTASSGRTDERQARRKIASDRTELFIAARGKARLHASFPDAVLISTIGSAFKESLDPRRWIQAELLRAFPAFDAGQAHARTETGVQVEFPQARQCFVLFPPFVVCSPSFGPSSVSSCPWNGARVSSVPGPAPHLRSAHPFASPSPSWSSHVLA